MKTAMRAAAVFTQAALFGAASVTAFVAVAQHGQATAPRKGEAGAYLIDYVRRLEAAPRESVQRPVFEPRRMFVG